MSLTAKQKLALVALSRHTRLKFKPETLIGSGRPGLLRSSLAWKQDMALPRHIDQEWCQLKLDNRVRIYNTGVVFRGLEKHGLAKTTNVIYDNSYYWQLTEQGERYAFEVEMELIRDRKIQRWSD